jgi:hypothetical protein
VTGATRTGLCNLTVYDGFYEAYLPPGQYRFTINVPGYAPQTWNATVSPGMKQQGQDIYLEQNNTALPETNAYSFTAISALGTSLYLLRRRDRNRK